MTMRDGFCLDLSLCIFAEIERRCGVMAEKVYNCQHFKWASWKHYDCKMWEYACKLKGGFMGTCSGICQNYTPKERGGEK